MTSRFTHGDTFLLLGFQRDYFDGGAIPVPQADELIPLVNEWIAIARASGVPVIVTREWHPEGHMSFVDRGGSRVAHCVQKTPGAAFHPDLRIPADAVIVPMGTDPNVDPSSAFDGTDLEARLRDAKARRIWIAGVRLDEEVRATALEALSRDFDVAIIAPATKIGASANLLAAAVLDELRDAGAFIGGRHLPGVRVGAEP